VTITANTVPGTVTLAINGMIEVPDMRFFDNPIIQEATVSGNLLGPVPGHINPAQEVKAKGEEVANAFRLRSDVALEYGNEFDNFITEWQQEETLWNKQSAKKQSAQLKQEMQEQEEQQEDNQQGDDNEND
jgi:hypothetical protein